MKIQFIILSLTTFLVAEGHYHHHGAACRPRPTYIPVQHPLWSYPRYIKVWRCFDSDHDHRYSQSDRCVPVHKEPVSVTVNNLQCKVYTHTVCTMKCACNVNGGRCRPLFEMDCYPGLQWDPYRCQCVEQCENEKKKKLRGHLECSLVE
jgi:hypothetical protein